MRIGILEAGRNRQSLVGRHGSYPDMFRALLDAGAPSMDFASYAALDGELPRSSDECDAWLVTGSRHTAFERLPWMVRLEALLQTLMDARRPVVGICFGHQILAQAMGGKVERAEAGWGLGIHTYAVTDRPAWMEGEEAAISLSVVHRDQVSVVPRQARIVAGSAFCPAAVLAYGDNAITFQAHPEFGPAFLADLVGELAQDGLPQDVIDRARADLAERGPRTDTALASRWIGDFLKASAGNEK